VNRPTCCGKNATPYEKRYGNHSIEHGFKCKRCGRIRIPFNALGYGIWMATFDAIRTAGIAFDNSL
jgi:hypothetical protein